MTNALSINPALADAVAYFSGLPRFTLSAVQAAFDKAHADTFRPRSIYSALCKDFNAVGQDLPPFPIFEEWYSGVRKGNVERPASPLPTPKRKEQPSALPGTKAAPDMVAELPAPATDAADVTIEIFATRLFDDVFAPLEREARAKAAEIVAARLRQIADRYVAAAA
ncbi:hypothetical protein [Agrobacterium larrymoorei]|uniref:Uncharacterized protein n=1 Tax=Agrobacterium larrymoorei TaxID=160699 RepID=A0ABU0UK98_9HYPH|nr:hypothetical protein [Agrobacterium larrymoorei]MDQ1185381.1 hypothetical protein [Agrobacterium larrymoorei]